MGWGWGSGVFLFGLVGGGGYVLWQRFWRAGFWMFESFGQRRRFDDRGQRLLSGYVHDGWHFWKFFDIFGGSG